MAGNVHHYDYPTVHAYEVVSWGECCQTGRRKRKPKPGEAEMIALRAEAQTISAC